MSRERCAVVRAPSLYGVAVLTLGAMACAGAGCHSSSPAVMGSGGLGGNAHDDASSDAAMSGVGGGNGIATDGGTGGAGGGSGDAATTGTGGAGMSDAATDVFGAGCNTLALGAPVTVTCAPDGGAPPMPTGGTIVPGMYTLTAITEYGACTAAAIAQTAELTADTVDTFADSSINGFSRVNGTYVVSGTDFVQTGTCPTTTTNTYQFSVDTTAGVTTITLISSAAPTPLVAVFTKQ